MKSREKKITSLLSIISEIESNSIAIQIVYQKNGLKKENICPASDIKKLIEKAWFFPDNANHFSLDSIIENINNIYYDNRKNFLTIQIFGGKITIQPCIINFRCPFCGNRPFNTEIAKTIKKKSL